MLKRLAAWCCAGLAAWPCGQHVITAGIVMCVSWCCSGGWQQQPSLAGCVAQACGAALTWHAGTAPLGCSAGGGAGEQLRCVRVGAASHTASDCACAQGCVVLCRHGLSGRTTPRPQLERTWGLRRRRVLAMGFVSDVSSWQWLSCSLSLMSSSRYTVSKGSRSWMCTHQRAPSDSLKA